MASILHQLDAEWLVLAKSPMARRSLIRWANAHPVLSGLHDLDDLLLRRLEPQLAGEVLRALAAMAPSDDIAARTLLQALLPGVVRLARVSASDDPAAVTEMVSLAWERIRTYPTTRHGSVAANVLLDVRKRYRQHRGIEAPRDSLPITLDPVQPAGGPEDYVLAVALLEELAAAPSNGVMSEAVLRTIVRTRLGGEPLADVAEEENIDRRKLFQRRWRAECRFRELALAS